MTWDADPTMPGAEPDHCSRCGRPLTPEDLPEGICEQCAEDERNRNFVDVEFELWREQQE